MTPRAPLPLLSLLACAGYLSSGCTDEAEPPPPDRQVAVTIAAAKPAATVSPRFLSFAVDTAQVVGGEFWDPAGGTSMTGSKQVPPYDFSRPKLRRLAKALTPAVLRVGGSAADETYYDLSPSPAKTPPKDYRWVLTARMLDGVAAFAAALDLRLLFTLNAGRGPRDAAGAWTPDNARELIRYARSKQLPVDVWELGNELNGYLLLLKLAVDEQTYAADLGTARKLLAAEDPQARLAGPSCAYWPKVGDFIGFYDKFMQVGGKALDLVTWHYYPQQSRRCVAKTRQATPTTMLQPENLDELATWAGQVERAANAHAAAGTEIWLGESGSAQCGGEPGVSDAFAGSFWWLDELGQLARRGQQVVIRQTLSGSNYGLIDDETLLPNPDYWASVLWKRLMGTRALAVKRAGDQPSRQDERVRVYAHCAVGDRSGDRSGGAPGAPGAPGGAVVALVLNLDQKEAVRVTFTGLRGQAERYVLSATGLTSRTVLLNGVALRVVADGGPPDVTASAVQSTFDDEDAHLDLEPVSIGFVVLRGAAAAACK